MFFVFKGNPFFLFDFSAAGFKCRVAAAVSRAFLPHSTRFYFLIFPRDESALQNRAASKCSFFFSEIWKIEIH